MHEQRPECDKRMALMDKKIDNNNHEITRQEKLIVKNHENMRIRTDHIEHLNTTVELHDRFIKDMKDDQISDTTKSNSQWIAGVSVIGGLVLAMVIGSVITMSVQYGDFRTKLAYATDDIKENRASVNELSMRLENKMDAGFERVTKLILKMHNIETQ